MPIRLNLLAEAQAAEDLRRRDPVKRAMWIAALLIALMLLWSGSVQLSSMLAHHELSRVEGQITVHTNEFQQVLGYQKKAADIQYKLTALRQLATNRFLNGTLLNALQQTTIEDVQLMKIKVEQAYVVGEEIKPKTNANGRVTLGRPATVTERIVLQLDARDTGPNPGDYVRVYRLKEALASNPYFQSALGKTNEVRLADLKPPTILSDTRPFVLFTLECRYPEVLR